jgi:hypothetical protein
VLEISQHGSWPLPGCVHHRPEGVEGGTRQHIESGAYAPTYHRIVQDPASWPHSPGGHPARSAQGIRALRSVAWALLSAAIHLSPAFPERLCPWGCVADRRNAFHGSLRLCMRRPISKGAPALGFMPVTAKNQRTVEVHPPPGEPSSPSWGRCVSLISNGDIPCPEVSTRSF